MIIIMTPHADESAIDGVLASIAAIGLQSHLSRGIERTLIGVIGDERLLQLAMFDGLPGVDRVLRVLDGYRLVSREFQHETSQVRIGSCLYGGTDWQLVLSCPDDEPDLAAFALKARQLNVAAIQADTFSVNDNPYGKSGRGLQAMEQLFGEARAAGLAWFTPLQDIRLLDSYLEADTEAIVLAGRAAADAVLLKEVGRINKPVILTRPPRASMAEWLMAAEHVAIGGNHRIILCEQGEQTESTDRGLPNLAELPLLKRESHLPVLFAPCSPAIAVEAALPLALAGMAAGADGLLLQATSRPAWQHAVPLATMPALIRQLQGLATLLGRRC